jgi:hypothetical protein
VGYNWGMTDIERMTTMQIYRGDLDWFRAWQRKISAKEGSWMSIPDSVRALIRQVDAAEESA